MNITLIGYRGTGKSSIGKRLADKLWMDFVDTDLTPYDTGTFASTGTSVATLGVQKAAEALRDNLLGVAARVTGVPVADCRLDDGRVGCGRRERPGRSRWSSVILVVTGPVIEPVAVLLRRRDA